MRNKLRNNLTAYLAMIFAGLVAINLSGCKKNNLRRVDNTPRQVEKAGAITKDSLVFANYNGDTRSTTFHILEDGPRKLRSYNVPNIDISTKIIALPDGRYAFDYLNRTSEGGGGIGILNLDGSIENLVSDLDEPLLIGLNSIDGNLYGQSMENGRPNYWKLSVDGAKTPVDGETARRVYRERESSYHITKECHRLEEIFGQYPQKNGASRILYPIKTGTFELDLRKD